MASLSHIPAITKLTPRVTRVLGMNPSPMTLQGTNTYLVGKGQDRILIDTADGTKPDYITNLKSWLIEGGARISSIILTHWHHDHVGGVQLIKNDVSDANTPVYKFSRPEDEIKWLQISDEQEFVVDPETTLKVVYTPGHTTDHVSLWLREENALFSGDCILGEGTAVFENLYDYMKSLDKILALKPAVIYPAHGRVLNEPMENIRHYIEHRNQRETQIIAVLNRNTEQAMSSMDIVKIVYATTPENLHSAAAKNVHNHLTKLVTEGKVVLVEEEKFKISKLAKL